MLRILMDDVTVPTLCTHGTLVAYAVPANADYFMPVRALQSCTWSAPTLAVFFSRSSIGV